MIEVEQLEPCRRKHARAHDADLVVEVGADRLEVLDWSLGGLRVASAPAGLVAAGIAPVRISARVGEMWATFDARVRLVREGPEGAALELLELPATGREVLRYLADASAEGEPVSVAGVLERVDPATEDPPTIPPVGTPAATAAASSPSRPPLRAFGYVAAGILLTAYVGNALYSRVWRIEVDAASLVAPTAHIASPSDGVLRELRVATGQRIAAGAPLFVVESPEVQADLERTALELAEAEVHVGRLEGALRAQQTRLAIHKQMMRSRVGSQRAQVALLEDRLGIADNQVDRLQDLMTRGVVSMTEMEEVAAWRSTVAGQLEQARSLLSTEEGRLGAARQGYYFDGDRIEDGLPEIEGMLAAARAEVELKKRQLDAQRLRAENAQSAKAPFTGRVARVLQTAGTPVREGSAVVLLEQEDDRMVEAWLTRQEAEYVRIGDTARVEVAGVDRDYVGVVRSIESDPTGASGVARNGRDPRLQVLLDLEGYAGQPGTAEAAVADLREVDSVGLPAVVSFARSWR